MGNMTTRRWISMLALALLAVALSSGCEEAATADGPANEPVAEAPMEQVITFGQVTGAAEPGDGVRIWGKNKCRKDAHCETFSCDCTCSAVSVLQNKSCSPSCASLVDPCLGLEAVCEAGSCVLDEEDVVPEGGCTVEQPCSGPFFDICFATDDPFCGICFNPEFDGNGVCNNDSDCFGGLVCDLDPPKNLCLCSPQPICVSPCMNDAQCEEGETCDSGGHCVDQPCVSSAGCPNNFACTSAGACSRKTCTSSSDCSGFCVKGQCYAEAGFCSPPPP